MRPPTSQSQSAGKPLGLWLLLLAGCEFSPASAQAPIAASVYVNQYFELREHGVPTKYVFNGETRVARSIAPFSPKPQVQRITVQAGWNLRSLAVTATNALAQLDTPHTPSPVAAVYKWSPSAGTFLSVSPGETLPAGTVLWLRALTNASLSLSGNYPQPTNILLSAGGTFLASAGLQDWDLREALPSTTSLWKYDSGATRWHATLGEPFRAGADGPDHLGPGEALFVHSAAPVELKTPDSAWRVLYYHEDHLGSSACISDAQGRLVSETAYYPYGGERTATGSQAAGSYYAFARKERDAEHGLLNFDTRLLWSAAARFVRVDSLADKFKERSLSAPQALNPYAYCLNNPLALVDPDGREARVIMHGNNQITIQVAIQYVGPLATKENIARANKGIEKHWTGKVGRYNVKMEVVDPAKDPMLQPAVITLTSKDDNGKNLRSFVNVEEDTGRWNAKNPDFSWEAAHETGHLLGLDDRYTDDRWGNSVADKGWRGNMMAAVGGRPEERNIKELMQNTRFVYLRSKGGLAEHHRKVFDKSPEGVKAAAAENQAANERDMGIQMRAWQLNDR